MQPTYLPWLGYFDLIDQSDIFVFLDTVQFEKQSWQQRNRIKVQHELHWLSVPVFRSGNSTKSICDMEVIYSPAFPKKHISTIEQNYSRTPYFKKYFSELIEIYESGEMNLSLLNERFISWIAQSMGIKTRLVKSSDMLCRGKRSELLVKICKEVGASDYLSPPGSVGYLLEDQEFFKEQGIAISVQNYEHPSYQQINPPFVPYASTLDLLFNEGDHSLEVIKSGRRSCLSLQEAFEITQKK